MNRSRTVKLGAVAVAAALSLAACGSSDNSSSKDTTTTTVAAKKTIVSVAAGNSDFSTLVSAVKAADLVETLSGDGPYTVFAPTNDAFAKVDEATLDELLKPENKDQLASILTYHVVAGKVMAADLTDGQVVETVNGQELTVGIDGDTVTLTDASGGTATVTKADLDAGNGVIHVIDSVLMPKMDDMSSDGSDDQAAASGTIVDVAAGNPDFSTLVAAVKAAALVDTLNGDGPFTVFAPTNDAFAKLPAGTVDELLKPENKDKLAAILTYHVVAGKVMAADLSDGQKVKTVQGDELTVGVDGDTVTLTDANGSTVNVTTADVPASNGVIHVIDGVVTPAS
ncbi:MAG: fasciclin domain-containing protein [Acidimicrobiales bacterium]